MNTETDEMSEARYALQLLTASDPEVNANMCRHLAALTILVTGRRGSELTAPEPTFQAGFHVTKDERNLILKSVMVTGVQHVFLTFDVDAATAPPSGLGLFRAEGDELACYPKCRLWSPPGDGRSVIVPVDTELPRDCHFVFRRGQPLARVTDLPFGDLEAGFRRGTSRMKRLAASDELRDVHEHAYQHIVTNAGPGRLEVETGRLAA